MSHTPHIWKPETRPQDCSDWITPEDVCRHALAAFYLARDAMKQPPGRRFVEPDGTTWSDRELFADNLAAVFELRIKTDGYHLGVQPGWAEDAKQLQRWTGPKVWFPHELQHPEDQRIEPRHPDISTTFPGYGAAPHGSEAQAEPARASQARHVGVLDAAAAVRLPQCPSAP